MDQELFPMSADLARSRSPHADSSGLHSHARAQDTQTRLNPPEHASSADPGLVAAVLRRRAGLLLALALGTLAAAVGNLAGAAEATRDDGADAATTATTAAETLLLEIRVLGRDLAGIFEVERGGDGQLVVPQEAWVLARLAPAGTLITLASGQRGYALDAVPGVSYQIDRSRLILEISAPPAAFDASHVLLADGRSPPPVASGPGAYLDYDVSATHAFGASSIGSLLEGVVFRHDSAFVAGGAFRSDSRDARLLRTDAYWRKDFPDSMQTLVIGDSVGSGGMWSQPARFGGVRFSRDFSLAPGYVSYPMPSISGEAALPSTVDVLINNRLSTSTEVPTGPFALSNVPIVTGAGEMQLVVRDLLGRETIIRQDYYVAPQLLRSGLSDFSVEAGALRESYGRLSNDYGAWFGAGTWRRGISDTLSGELHAELQSERQAAGAGVTAVVGQIGVLAIAAGYAVSNGERGGRYRVGFQHAGSAGGINLSLEHNDRGYAEFAAGPLSERVKDQWGGSAGLVIGGRVNLGVSYTQRTTWNQARFTLASASVGVPLPGNAYLSVNAGKQLERGGWYGSAHVIVPLDGRRTASASSSRSNDGQLVSALQATQSLPSGPGWGWGLGVSDDASRRAQAAAGYNGNHGQFSAEAGLRDGDADLRLGTSGAIGWLHGLAFATRRIDQGAFAVVRVGDVPGVPVFLSNQVVAVTNDQGLALVPRLLPFQSNQLTIRPDELPLDVEIRSVREQVIPYARSGVLVDFPVRRTRAALVVLHDASGAPLPAGAWVKIKPEGRETVVFMRGETYLMDLEENSWIEVHWKDGACTLPLPPIPDTPGAEAPRIGPLTCAEAK
jgi:outer membrane usher protein